MNSPVSDEGPVDGTTRFPARSSTTEARPLRLVFALSRGRGATIGQSRTERRLPLRALRRDVQSLVIAVSLFPSQVEDSADSRGFAGKVDWRFLMRPARPSDSAAVKVMR